MKDKKITNVDIEANHFLKQEAHANSSWNP